MPRKNGDLEFRRAHPKAPLGHVGILTTLDEIFTNISACWFLADFLISLKIITDQNPEVNSENEPLPDKFPLPSKLTQLPHEVQTNE